MSLGMCVTKLCANVPLFQARDDGGAQLPPTRVSASGSRASSSVSGVAQKDIGNLDAGLGDILRRSRHRGGSGQRSARSHSGRSSARSTTPVERNGVSRQSSKSSLDGRYFAP